MDTKDLGMLLLGVALIIHTLEEAWLPEYEKLKPDWRSVVFNRSLFLENFPIFIFAIAVTMVGWKFPLVGGILPAIGLTHPLLDHLGLSWKARKVRSGSRTGLFLLLPLSIWVYAMGNIYNLFELHEFLISGVLGLAISIWLFWTVEQETQESQ